MKLSHHVLTNATAGNKKPVKSFLLVEEQLLIPINMPVMTHDLSQTGNGQQETEWAEPQTVFYLNITLNFS